MEGGARGSAQIARRARGEGRGRGSSRGDEDESTNRRRRTASGRVDFGCDGVDARGDEERAEWGETRRARGWVGEKGGGEEG